MIEDTQYALKELGGHHIDALLAGEHKEKVKTLFTGN